MSTIVIMPGGFHPFHAGHMALYNSAKKAFPGAEVYVAATNDTKTRPFPFAIKEKLAKVAGVSPGHFIQVKSPFQPREITDKFNPEQDVVIFVRSAKDKNESPKPGGTKKDGSPAYFQPYTGKDVQPFGKHAYMSYLPTVEFGPGITSATEIRNAWPKLDDRRKTAMVMSLYPATQKNPKLAANVVKMLDMGMGNELDESWKQNLGAAALAGGMALGGLSSMGKTADTNWDKLPQQMSTQQDSKGGEKIMSITGPNNKGEYRVRVTTDNDVQEFITKTPPKTLNEFVPPSSDRGAGGGGDDRSRRIRKLLEIAIQVAKEKNVDELGMIHAMNMIAGDDFFSVAVEGILPDITDKEYMFVLQSAYKTVKQGLSEGKDFNRCFDQACKLYDRAVSKNLEPKLVQVADFQGDGNGADPRWMKLPQHVWQHYVVIVGDQVLDPTAKQFGDTMLTQYQVSDLDRIWGKQYQIRPSQGVAEGDVITFKQPSKTLTWKQVPKDVLLLANDWLWAEYDNTGLDAVMDPKGFGNGTANELQYITAKLQQKGWTIDYNDENDGPDEYNLILTNKRGQTVLLSIEDAQTFSGWAKGTSSYPSLNEGPIVKRIVHPNMINIYVRPGSNKPPLLVATDIPYKIFDKYVNKAIQKYPQFKQTDFSFKSSDKINEFVTPSGGDDREPDEEILRKLAAMWWNGSIQQMKKAQQTLQAMGWDIGQDESGDDDAGVFVIRIGDEDGDSYIAFNHSDLDLNEDYLDEN